MSLYEAHLHGEKVTDPDHMPVILHLPHAMLLDLGDGGDEAEVVLNMTAQEAPALAMHLLEAACAAEGGMA